MTQYGTSSSTISGTAVSRATAKTGALFKLVGRARELLLVAAFVHFGTMLDIDLTNVSKVVGSIAMVVLVHGCVFVGLGGASGCDVTF